MLSHLINTSLKYTFVKNNGLKRSFVLYLKNQIFNSLTNKLDKYDCRNNDQ